MAPPDARSTYLSALVHPGRAAGKARSPVTLAGSAPRAPRAPSRLALGLLAALALLAAAAAVAIVVTSDVVAAPVANGLLRGFIIASWVAVGLLTWRRQPGSRLGRLLVAEGLGFALTTPIALPEPGLHASARVAWAVFFVGLVYVVLAYPTGHLQGRASEIIVKVLAAGTALLWLPLLLSGSELPRGAALTRCAGACPPSPIDALHLSTATVDVLSRLVTTLNGAIVIAVAVVLWRRLRAASAASRTTLLAPLVMLMVAAVAYGLDGLVRVSSGDDARAALFLDWVGVLAMATFPYALLIGQVRGRVFSGAALSDTLGRLTGRQEAGELRAVLAEGLRDPTLRLAYWVPGIGSYVDPSGSRITLEELRAGGAVTEVGRPGRPIAAIVHDPALDEAPGLMEAAGDALLLALENGRLQAELHASIRELRASQSRLVAAGARERRRLERELHDSAQNRLVGLQIRLRLAMDRTEDEAPALAATLAGLAQDAEAAVDELRRIAHGISPPLLDSRGLVEALRAEVGHSGIPVSIIADDIGLSRPELETALYFSCLESIQNAAKHAGPTATVAVRLRRAGDELAFSIRDDGRGFDASAVPNGAGLTGVRDRIGAVGGRVEVTSAAGRGVTVAGAVPWPPRPPESAPGSPDRDDVASAYPS